MRSPLFWALTLGVLSASGPALATPNFPADIAAALGISTPPGCGICHAGQPGRGTATTPFAVAMLARGLVPGDDVSVTAALNQMTVDQVDSNGNGIPDVEELRLGNDPNATSTSAGQPQLAYGCAWAAGSGSGPLVGLGLLALAALLYRRRR